MIQVKRIYDDYEPADGYRVLVDRLWPRGIKKENAHIDLWLKEIAPSTELRKWIHADMSKWKQFETKYKKELEDSEALGTLKSIVRKHKTVTLLYTAKGEEQNHALILKELMKK
jgi:uncharacterized protein YeaO (DUF488 family)